MQPIPSQGSQYIVKTIFEYGGPGMAAGLNVAGAARGASANTSEALAARYPDLELRTITVPESGNAGTRLFAEVSRALADIPRSRLAGRYRWRR